MRSSSLYPLKHHQGDSYWDVCPTGLEALLLGSAAILILTIHLDPILHSGAALPLTVLLAAICYLSPVSGFMFVACSQYLPFPEEATLNPSQIGFFVWLPVVLFRYSRVRLTGLWRLWPVVPCLTWYVLMTGEKLYLPSNNYFRALCYAVIACQLINEARGQYLKCLFGLSVGAMLVMSAYWANQAGLPVELSDWGSEREGIARIGGTRADSVMVWPALLIGMAGLIGLQLALWLSDSPRRSPAWLTWLTGFLCMAALPPMIATMTHAAIGGMGLLLIGILFVCVRIAINGGFTPRQIRLLVCLSATVSMMAMAGYATDFLEIRTKAKALADYYRETAQETGAFTSRNDVWRYSIRTILKYPIYGIVNSHEPEDTPPEYTDESERWMSHNVFLDYGRFGGVPGMFLVAIFFFYPAWKMAFSRQRAYYIPFFLIYLAMFIFWMSLSYIHYKTFWAFWIWRRWPQPIALMRLSQ